MVFDKRHAYVADEVKGQGGDDNGRGLRSSARSQVPINSHCVHKWAEPSTLEAHYTTVTTRLLAFIGDENARLRSRPHSNREGGAQCYNALTHTPFPSDHKVNGPF